MTPANLRSQPHGGWDGILDPDEKILWQGRPGSGIHLRGSDYFMIIFGTFFAGFALFWMVGASSAGGVFWMFGLLHFFAGLGVILWPILGRPYVRSRTWYTLTSKRAFIAAEVPIRGKTLKSYPITPDTTLTLEDGIPGSVLFAQERRRGKNGYYTVPIGYERINDARDVYALLRKVQRGEA